MHMPFVYTAFPFSIGHILFFEMKTRQKRNSNTLLMQYCMTTKTIRILLLT